MKSKIMERYFFFAFLLIIFISAFFIFRPFWTVLLLGGCFAIVLHPIHERLNKKMGGGLSAFLTLVFFILIIGLPLFGIGTLVFNQSQEAYGLIASKVTSFAFIDSINDSMNKFLPAGMHFDLYEKASSVISFISSNLAKVFTSTISALFSVLLTLLAIFYFLKDGTRWKKAVIMLSPLSDADDEKIVQKLKIAINGILKGYLLMALIQGILMGLGLTIFGVPNPALWGLFSIITALVPTVGTAIVSVPAIVFLFLTGSTLQGVGLLVWSILIVGMIDNFLSPYIVGSKTDLPPLLILFSVLGGISTIGPIGILVGPLTLSLLYTLLSIYRNEFQAPLVNDK